MRKILLIFIFICFGIGYSNVYSKNTALAVQQQTKNIRGRVTDVNARPMVGVNIIELNTTNGTITDSNGDYSIAVNNNSVLRFSFLGYIATEIQVLDRDRINVVLKEDKKILDEIVVIGYGETNKRDLTGSVGELKVKDLQKAPVSSFDQALAGRISGVQVTSTEGQPGSDVNIVIRGGNSLTQSNAPLYVVDGFPIEDFSVSSLNPEDIESINVLKDASATAVYGSRGANGVIIIETKKGKIGTPSVTYHGYYGIQRATKRMEMMNPYEFVKYQIEMLPDEMTQFYLTKHNMNLDDYKNAKNIDWQSLLFRDAVVHNNDLSIRGATDNTKYSFSGSYINQDGIIINSGFNRFQTRVSIDQRITRKLSASVNINYSQEKVYGSLASEMKSSSNSYASFLMYRILGYRPVSIGTDIIDELIDPEDDNVIFLLNPLISTNNEIRQESKPNLLANFGLTYEIFKDLTLYIRGGFNRRTYVAETLNNSKTYRGITSSWNLKGVNGTYSNTEIDNWVNENRLTYKKRINKNHYFDVMSAFTMQGTTYEKFGFESINISNEELGIRSLSNGTPTSLISLLSKNSLMSFLGRVNYNYKSKYLFTISVRADGSSKFASPNRWGVFPSGAFAWHMGEEKFMDNIEFINESKLRISYGITGNNRIGDFVSYQKINLSDYYSFGNETPKYASIVGSMGNKNLKWEETAQLDLGYDLSMFNNRISLKADLYSKTTKNVLLNADVPLSTGSSKIYKNIGKIRNKGLELTLNTINVRNRDFYWESEFNISFNDNKILELSEGQTNILSWVSFTGDYNGSYSYLAQVGGPAASIYGYIWEGNYQYEDFDVVDGKYILKSGVSTNGNTLVQPGDIKYSDVNEDGTVNEKDRVIIGRGLPIHYGGFTNNIGYKGFNLSVFFQWNYGNDIINANRLAFEGNFANRYSLNQFASYVNRWTPDNQTNENFRIGGGGPKGRYSSKIVEDGSFLRLKTVQLGYSFPKKARWKLKSLEVYCAVQNLYTWTKYSGYDPEVSVQNSTLTPGFDYSSYPRNLTMTLGVKVGL
jgi:TonB-linked SusC/RagA family outer membrane protein